MLEFSTVQLHKTQTSLQMHTVQLKEDIAKELKKSEEGKRKQIYHIWKSQIQLPDCSVGILKKKNQNMQLEYFQTQFGNKLPMVTP